MDLYTQIRAQAGITIEMLSTFTSLELAGWEGALVCSSSLHLALPIFLILHFTASMISASSARHHFHK